MATKTTPELQYEIVNACGILSTSNRGWTKELNLISWNGRSPKYDIREWSPDHDRMGKGVTLTEEEAVELKVILNKQKDL